MRILLPIGVVFATVVGLSQVSCFAADGENKPEPSADAAQVRSQHVGQSADARPTSEAGGGAPVARSTAAVGGSHSLRFQFASQPWKDVLEWFARQADLSLIMDSPPPGTFNYSDSHEYTPAEAIDLINSVLLTKGYTLIRRDRMLMLINLEDGIPPNLVQTVSVDSLGSKGEFELVRVLFDLEKFKPEDAEAEVKKLLGPQGSVVALPKSRQLLVTDTAGRLRAVRAMINRIEKPEGSGSGNFKTLDLKYVRSEDVLPIIRQLLDIPEDKMAASDGSLRIAVEPRNGRLMFLSGQPEKVGRAVDIIQELDIPSRGRVRTFPMSVDGARAAVDRIETVWPTLRANKLHVVAPPPAAPASLPTAPATPPDANKPGSQPAPANPPKTRERPTGSTTMNHPARIWGGRVVLVAEQSPAKTANPPKASPSAPPITAAHEPPPVIVMIGPNGLTVISDDPTALDEFERLLGMVTPQESSGPPIPVFYLKYAKAATVADSLERIFSESESSSSKEGDSAGSSTTGREGSIRRLATGPIRITPDPRLNALLIQANRADLENIRQVLEVLDMKESPEDVSVAPKPRMIPVMHTRATEVAEVIREVYADRMVTPSGSNQGSGLSRFGGVGGGGRSGRSGRGGRGGGNDEGGGGGSPFGGFGGPFGGFAAALAGGGDGQSNRRDEANRLGVGVDARTNSLVVTATDPVFDEVKQLVSQLDVAAGDQNTAVQVIALHQTSASAMERALAALAGDGVQVNQGEAAKSDSTGSTSTSTSQPAWMQRATRSRSNTSGGQSGNAGGSPQYQGFGGFNGGGFNGGSGYNGGGYNGGGGRRGFGRSGQQGSGQGGP